MKGISKGFYRKRDREIFGYMEDLILDSDGYKYATKILELRYSRRLMAATWTLMAATDPPFFRSYSPTAKKLREDGAMRPSHP